MSKSIWWISLLKRKIEVNTISPYENVNPDTISLYENFVRISVLDIYASSPFKGKFYVMIKSDGEIEKKTCSQLDCGTEERDHCVTAASPSIVWVQVSILQQEMWEENMRKESNLLPPLP